MSITEKPVITICHQLPGRIRLRFSCAPKAPGLTVKRVQANKGVLSVQYTPLTGSMLIRYDPVQVSAEKIIIRTALCVSLDHGKVPVKIQALSMTREWSDSPIYSGFSLFLAVAARAVTVEPQTLRVLDWMAGLSTAGAVLNHGLLEVRRHGSFDPEVLSIVYLLAAFFRGQFLTASLVTWFASFGRHLLKPPPRGVELRITHIGEDAQGAARYGIIVSATQNDQEAARLYRVIPAILQYAFLGGTTGEGLLLNDIRDLVSLHDEVLQDMGEMNYALPVRLNQG